MDTQAKEQQGMKHMAVVLMTIAKERRRLLNWLCPVIVSPEEDQELRRSLATRGTGQWVFEHQAYKEWIEEPESFLWLHGPSKTLSNYANIAVGSGKSFLAFDILVKL
jgi:hypothetical protein